MTRHPIDLITVNDPVSVQNLTIFPLCLSQTHGPAYVSSAVAIGQHGLRVTEVSDGGSVPNLMVINPSDVCVLLLDGEELRGAKQNRVINTTILLAARSQTIIPVSCTEQGRWHYTSTTFQAAKTVMPAQARMRKTRSVSHSLEAAKAFHSNQGEVWQGVQELHDKVGSQSPTSAMADAFEQVRGELEDAIRRIPAQDGQHGMLAMIDSRPAGMDLLSRADVYRELHGQLLQSYAMEALAAKREALRRPAPAAARGTGPAQTGALAAKAFLERCAAIKGKAYPSVGLGTDWRFSGEGVVGSGLEVEGAWIHMAYFMDDQQAAGQEPGHRIARMSRRADYRRQGHAED